MDSAAARRIGLAEPELSRVALEVVEDAPVARSATVAPVASAVPFRKRSFAVQGRTFGDPDNDR